MVLEKLKRIILEYIEIDDQDFVAELSFAEDLGFDELDMADLTMDVEDCFEIELSDESLEAIKTIGDLVKFIENNIE